MSLDDVKPFSCAGEDVWNKFDFFDMPTFLSDYEDPFAASADDLTSACFNEIPFFVSSQDEEQFAEIMLHDCMWSGRCLDESHVGNCLNNTGVANATITEDSVKIKTSKVDCNESKTREKVAPGRSLLLNSRYRQHQQQTSIKQPQANLLPLNQGFRELNIMQALKHVSSRDVPKYVHRPTPPDSSCSDTEDRRIEVCKISVPTSSDDDDDDDDDEEDDDEEEDYVSRRHLTVTNSGSNAHKAQQILRQQQQQQQMSMRFQDGDHCYSLMSKECIESLGVQTPSDSEEEIDVVSVGDKTLPTNPSMRDRRHLQSTVARKISESRIVKQPGGLKTLPPRRTSNQQSLAPAQAQTQPAARKRRRRSSTSDEDYDYEDATYVSYGKSSKNSRRAVAGPPKKRGRKRRNDPFSPTGSLGSADSSAPPEIEKRSQHNNMERQRRISLKNLFEQLKSQVPSISSKDRAPKVTILREAATLCRQLTLRQEKVEELQAEQQLLLRQVRMLRKQLAGGRSSDNGD